MKQKLWAQGMAGGADAASRREMQMQARLKAEAATLAERRLALHRLDMDMERIAHSIEQDIKESAASPREHRLLVAEFGMLDAQLTELGRLLESLSADADAAAAAVEPEALLRFGEAFAEDESELELIKREVGDLKLRLGMDLESPTLALPDMEKIARYVRETVEKLRSALDFYVTGTKLLGQDIQYALALVGKAIQGYTLKPREVRTLRRSGKDLLTLIPTIIILILPLSPVGHVLVFSFIQRYFPDFFPSTFTERRQNLLKMYEEVEKVEQKGDDEDTDDALEKLRKKFIATLTNTDA
ncbi:hypothetical protein JKP88DRAFT_226024 [Tribonema minus]|uniref:Letm1 RBD domain-containing protein n=1 Tax=Tribonema minus TaxID=303371 RepID=A0A836CA55_9STRA|nr:hypothetical protein JKP88DRAFT_226024 [Tribonema minus]